jgi:hypothetical protein
MPEGVMEKQPDRAAVWTFQEAEAVGSSEVNSFNSRVHLVEKKRSRRQGRKRGARAKGMKRKTN